MPPSDWSVRYLWLAILSMSGTTVVWMLDSTSVIYVAFVTIAAFTTLALFHAHRLRTYPRRRKIDRTP